MSAPKRARDGEPAKFLLLGHPTAAEPGNLCNTAGGSGLNNARLARRNGSDTVSVYATRNIAAGDEILVPYGSRYTRELRGRTEEQDDPALPRYRAPPAKRQGTRSGEDSDLAQRLSFIICTPVSELQSSTRKPGWRVR